MAGTIQRYIGFYWTLPVNWAGFQSLPDDVDEAAEQSRTIRYQRDLVRSWVKSEKGVLVEEKVHLEFQPDRGSAETVPVVEKVLRKCREDNAMMLYVDFGLAYGWRSHTPLRNRLAEEPLAFALPPDEILMDGALFNPVDHFRSWQEIYETRKATASDQKAAITAAIEASQSNNPTLAALAEQLNEQGLKTVTGKLWTEDNLRKFLKAV